MKKELLILLVEDNEGDVLLTSETLDCMEFSTEIEVVRTGRDAMDYLGRKGKYEHARVPGLILLDINLPVRNGFEVLAFIRSESAISGIPVIILTTSSSPIDIKKAQELDVDLFLTKPGDVDNYDLLGKEIERFCEGYFGDVYKNEVL